MHYFFLDASALVKRYHREAGSDVVNYLLDRLLARMPERLATSLLIISETVSVLTRQRNAGHIPNELFRRAVATVLLEARAMDLQSVDDGTILNSIPLISRHNINAADALHLHQALSLQHLLRPMGHTLVLLASDQRLLRAARHEGLLVLNPEEAAIEEAEEMLKLG
ncbi:MAG: PIN domain-containing protein [Chloroflexi bacterium]|nr:MAG: PIN domain-containing protein [Chloroflexota bacterium]